MERRKEGMDEGTNEAKKDLWSSGGGVLQGMREGTKAGKDERKMGVDEYDQPNRKTIQRANSLAVFAVQHDESVLRTHPTHSTHSM